MVDYSGMKVPELKKLLSERSLIQTGNKADLIARLVENDKLDSEAWEPEGEAKKTNEDEIDYDDDDFPPAKSPAKPAATAAKTSAAPSSPTQTKKPAAAPAAEKPETKAAAPVAAAAEAPTTQSASENSAVKETAEAAPKEPAFTQNLPPTNAKSEAEKRAARAARFGITEDKDSEEARKAARAARFGIGNEDVSAIDSALPDRPRKRGREEKEDDSRVKKRQSGGPGGPVQSGAGRNAGHDNRNNTGNARSNRRHRNGGGPKGAVSTNGQKTGPKPSAAIDAAEKAKMDARAKRFAAST